VVTIVRIWNDVVDVMDLRIKPRPFQVSRYDGTSDVRRNFSTALRWPDEPITTSNATDDAKNDSFNWTISDVRQYRYRDEVEHKRYAQSTQTKSEVFLPATANLQNIEYIWRGDQRSKYPDHRRTDWDVHREEDTKRDWRRSPKTPELALWGGRLFPSLAGLPE